MNIVNTGHPLKISLVSEVVRAVWLVALSLSLPVPLQTSMVEHMVLEVKAKRTFTIVKKMRTRFVWWILLVRSDPSTNVAG